MSIYLDHNATTPVDPRVFEVMLPFVREEFGNPSSAHARGAVARRAIDRARREIGELIRVDESWVNFTASATEAVNTAMWSAFTLRPRGRTRVVVTAVEHAAVLESARALERFGVQVQIVPVAPSGAVDVEALSRTVTDDTFLVAVMWANNETGVIFPIARVAEICAARGVLLLVDAVQAAGRLPIDLQALPIGYLTLSSHKIFGPKGAGALVGAPRMIQPLIRGGGQESGRRAGTENVSGLVGFGEAARLARAEGDTRSAAAGTLRDAFEHQLLGAIEESVVNGSDEPRLPNTTSVTIPGVDGDALVGILDAAGICISTGSACHARSIAPSHVIAAMTGSHARATETVRFSFSHLNDAAEVDAALLALTDAVASLRSSVARSR